MTREAPNFEVNPDFKAMQSFLTTKTRLVLSSGGDSPILDNSGNGNSIFANIFNKSLSEQKNPFTISEIYTKLAKNIVRISEELGLIQTPLLSPIFKSGHEAPDFVFIPKSK